MTDEIDTVHDETAAEALDETACFEERWHACHCTDALMTLNRTRLGRSLMGWESIEATNAIIERYLAPMLLGADARRVDYFAPGRNKLSPARRPPRRGA
jgi:hypothetical protein